MKVVRLQPGMLGPQLRKDGPGFAAELRRGLQDGARRGRAHLVRETPTYLGQMRAGWRDAPTGSDSYQVENTAPHAGIVERGARPHGVSPDGREAITVYIERTAGVPREQAEAMAWGYIEKLRTEGQEGQFIVEHSLDKLRDFVRAEIERHMGEHHK